MPNWRRLAAAVVIMLPVLGLAMLVPPAQASVNVACNRYDRLLWARTQGLSIPQDVVNLAKHLCDEASMFADQLPEDTVYAQPPCTMYSKELHGAARPVVLERMGDECIGSWAWYVRERIQPSTGVATSEGPGSSGTYAQGSPNDTSTDGGSDSLPWWADKFKDLAIAGGVMLWIVLGVWIARSNADTPDPPGGGEGPKWGRRGY